VVATACTGLVVFASCSERDGESPAAPAVVPPGEELRVQVALRWGGGATRQWRGTCSVEATRVEWVWLTDFEEGDLYLADGFPAADQGVPPGWTPAEPSDFRTAPDTGASWPTAHVETVTSGEADGLCFNVVGPSGARVQLDLGDGARLEATLAELVRAPRVVHVPDSESALVAEAIDLERDAEPIERAIERAGKRTGLTAYRASLHTHSPFSTNERLLEPVRRSLTPFVDVAWWTDHNLADERTLVAGDFEDAAAVETFWSASAEHASVAFAGPSSDAFRGTSAFRLEVVGRDEPGGGWIEPAGGAGWMNVGLPLGPRLRWAWKPDDDRESGASVAYVEVRFNSGRRLRYLSGATDRARPRLDIVLAAPPGEWSTVERDVAADVRALSNDARIDGLLGVAFGVLCPGDERARVSFDDVELVVPSADECVALAGEHLIGDGSYRSFLGLEQSAWRTRDGSGGLVPHLTVLVPDATAELLRGWDHEPTFAERAAFVARIHAANGVVGTHHMQFDEHYEALLDAHGFGGPTGEAGIDLFELGGAWKTVPVYATADERRDRDAHGYPALTEDELYPLLVRWDRATARGLLLTGYGAPDMHGRFDEVSEGWRNRWLTTILADDDSAPALLGALRSGRVSASDATSRAIVSLSVDGRSWMGKLVATDRATHSVEVHVDGAVPGSRVRWIVGPLVRARADSSADEPRPVRYTLGAVSPASDFEQALEVDTREGVFVRAELLDPTGHLVALGNPVVFTPYFPSVWPEGRVAYDWNGQHFDGEPGVIPEAVDGDPPTADVRALPRRKQLVVAIDVGVLASEEGHDLDGFGDPYRGSMPLNLRAIEDDPASLTLAVPAGEPSWLRLRTVGFCRRGGRVLMDGEELGSFPRMSSKTFEIAAAEPGSDEVRERRFTIELDDAEEKPMLLQRVELWRGDGVVEY
jgi:hypothetical protein